MHRASASRERVLAAASEQTHVVADAPGDLDTCAGRPHGARWCGLEHFAAEITHGCKRVVREHRFARTSVLWQRPTGHSTIAARRNRRVQFHNRTEREAA